MDELQAHLFPGDGNEAVALVLCGRRDAPDTHVLSAHKLFLSRTTSAMTGSPARSTGRRSLPANLRLGDAKHMAVLKIHSHPGYYRQFSEVDDASDSELFSSLHGWTDDGMPHASAVMLPNKEIFARVVTAAVQFVPMDRILIAGDDISFFDHNPSHRPVAAKDLRTAQAFGEKTVGLLNSLRVGVVGCSGTGSWVVEQLARLGVGELILVHPDVVEHKNLNRIVNSTARGRPEQDGKGSFSACSDRADGDVHAGHLTAREPLQSRRSTGVGDLRRALLAAWTAWMAATCSTAWPSSTSSHILTLA